MIRVTDLSALRPRDKCLADVPHVEDRRRFDVVPVLLSEGINPATYQPDKKPDHYLHEMDTNPIENGQRGKLGSENYAFFFPPFFPLDILLFFLRHRSETEKTVRNGGN